MRNAPRAAALLVVSVAALALCVGAQPSTLELHGSTIVVMNANGSAQRNLTTDGLSERPDWSATGDKIVYARSTDQDPVNSIWVVNADGSNGHSLLDDGQTSDQPAWSPDGSKIAFQHVFNGNWDLAVMDADGQNITNLTSSARQEVSPAWSPGGTRIAFAIGTTVDTDGGIFVIDRTGGNEVRLTTNPMHDDSPTWSPDGTRIAFDRRTNSSVDLMVMNSDGSGLVTLSHDYDLRFTPAWSPDGSKIAFARGSTSDTGDIYLINPDGTHLVQLTTGAQYADWAPAWSPDGTRIAFARSNYVQPPPPPPPPPSAPPLPPRCRVPRVIGLRLAKARTAIRRARCAVGAVRRARSKRVGRVLSQKPRAGRTVARGTKIRLVVGRR